MCSRNLHGLEEWTDRRRERERDRQSSRQTLGNLFLTFICQRNYFCLRWGKVNPLRENRRGERGNKEMSQTQRIVGKYRHFLVKENGFQLI